MPIPLVVGVLGREEIKLKSSVETRACTILPKISKYGKFSVEIFVVKLSD